MNRRGEKRNLILALGNDLLGDDAVGLEAARVIARDIHEGVEVLEANASGFELLELLCGHPGALIIDAMHTGRVPPGTISALSLEELLGAQACSPHYAGLPDVARLAKRLDLDFPEAVLVLAMEIDPPRDLHIGLSDAIREALPAYVGRIRNTLRRWHVPVSPVIPLSSCPGSCTEPLR